MLSVILMLSDSALLATCKIQMNYHISHNTEVMSTCKTHMNEHLCQLNVKRSRQLHSVHLPEAASLPVSHLSHSWFHCSACRL